MLNIPFFSRNSVPSAPSGPTQDRDMAVVTAAVRQALAEAVRQALGDAPAGQVVIIQNLNIQNLQVNYAHGGGATVTVSQ